jgi:hypothetical protein
MKKRKWSIEQLKEAVKNSSSYRQVLSKLGLNPDGGATNAFVKRMVEQENINTSHFTGQAHLRGKKHNWTKSIPLQELLKKNVYTHSHRLKKRLYKAGLLEEKCSECSTGNVWNGKPISLHLEHVNGDHSDNRIENLKILCPNCHSQTDTYAAKKLKK